MPIRYLTAACAFTLVILGLLTLAFSTNAKRALYVMQSSSSVNVALSSNGAVASASSVHVSGNYPVAAVNNGDRKAMNWGSGGGWNDNTHGDYSSDIVQIDFPAFNFVSQINVLTLRDNFQDNQTPPTLTETFSTCENTGFGITEFEVQYWNGSMWVTVPSGFVRDNNKVWRQFTFPEVWAGGVRVQVHGAARFTTIAINYSRVVEIEAFGRTSGFNLAAAVNGAVASASSTVNANYPASAVNDGDRTGFNWGRGGFGSGWNDATENEYSIDWVRINFAAGQARRINEIDVYTLRDGYSTKPDDPTIFETFSTADNTGEGMTDYDVQYLTGGVWRTVPGGEVTNNNKVRRQFRFSPITTNAIRVAVHKGANYTTFGNNWSRLVEIEAWENAAAPDDLVWGEDALPAGAVPSGAFEDWNWTCFIPLPLSGTLAHTSEIVAGVHQHFFQSATQTLTVNAGDTLGAHVYLDSANPPTSVMLQWNDGTWEHRAYWGANQFPWGVDGTVSRRNMGALPPTGQWVRLEVPASLVGLEGRTLNGMAFSLFNGRATWDHAGKYAGTAPIQPTISISDATLNEGNSGTTSAVFNVTLSSASTQTISVNYATAHGTTNSFDIIGASGTLTFSPGQTSKPISVTVFGDTVFEANENFFVNLTNPINATIADGQAVGTILNDDVPPPITISISGATVFEGSCGGTPSAVFRVNLSDTTSQNVSVNFVTSDGSALSSADYIAASGTVTIPSGQTTATITVLSRSDTLVEGDETFFVNLSGPANAVIADGQGQAIIKDDDATPPVSNPGSLGEWEPCEELETVPVHMSLLPNGRLLYWGRDKVTNPNGNDDGSDVGGGCNTYTWDPITKAKSGVIRNGTTNLFCSSHSFLPDGRLMVAGGHFRDNSRPYQEAMGERHINVFNPSTSIWSLSSSLMPRGRWYPSSVTLGFGETAIFAGTYWTGTVIDRNPQPDIYNLQNALHQSPANKSIRSYPYLHLADDGRVFGLAGTNGWFFDPFSHEFTDLPAPPSFLEHFEGSSVLYNAEAGKVMVAGGRQGSNGVSLSQVDIFDMKSRVWAASPMPNPMNFARQYHNLTLLPDGKVLATGGQTCEGATPNAECPAVIPEIWDPTTGTWTRLGENPTRTPRIYHSVALLLRDGRVLVGGGGLPAAKGERVVNTTTNTIFTCSGDPSIDPTLCRHVGHKDAEIFSPPYLFQSNGLPAPRPTINRPVNSPPLSVSLGETFTISISSSSPVNTVALMRLPSVTHGLNFDQRRVVLTPQTPSTTSLTLTMPDKGTICPPGYYMMFVIANGVPSVAEFIKVSAPTASTFALFETGTQVARNLDGRLQVFYKGSDNAIYYTAQTSAGGAWSQEHIRLGGAMASNPVAIANTDGRLEVFARDTNNTIYHAWQLSPGSSSWSGWFALGGSAVGDPAVARNSNGRLQLIYRGTDNAVYTAAQTLAGSTHGWSMVHTTLGGSFTSDPSVVLNADGRVEVFIRGSDSALYHAWQNTAGSSSWSNWFSLGGSINSVKVGVARNTDGTLQVFYRGGDNGLYFTRQSSSFPGGWTPNHTSLGGGLTSDPTVGINNDGRWEVFVRGTDTALWHNWQTAPSGSVWSGYAFLGGGLTSGAALARNANGRLSAIVRGVDNALYYNVQTSPGSSSSWEGYVLIGGNASSF